MARRYSRDNRGRFASGGTGATARGGRLKTASGNKRATQTTKAAGAKPSGTVAGKVKRNPAAAGKIGQAKAAAPRATKRKAIGAISEAKAGRIINRIDANRPGLRKATGSARKTQNSIRTQRKATDFALAAGTRARKQGKSLSVNESLQRGVKNAAAKSRKSPTAATPAASRPDRAASNIPMRGARGRALNAEISRNVNAQKTADRAASKASNRQFKSDQSRAKKLREVHLGPLATGYAQRSGRKVADVKAAISGMAPSGQVKLFRQYVRENRGTARAATPAAPKAVKPASKVDTSMSGLARRRARANAPRNSTYLSQKLNTRSAITRSAANAIYNEQRKGVKTLFGSQLPTQIAKAGLIGKGLSGSKRERAEANREAARKRVLKGKRR